MQGAPAQVLIPISNEVLRLLRSLKETRDSRDPVDGRAPRSFADFLADGIPASDPLHDDAVSIREAGTRAADLTHQLLAFGRRQALRPTVVDAGDVVAGIAPILHSLMGDEVALVISRSGPIGRVRVDRAELEGAIVNLVLNARDAMPGGGSVAIEAADETVGANDPRLHPPAEPGEYVRISVTDTGTGIAPDVLPHVFEPFFTTKALGRGSGLGLSSVEGAVVQSGGFVGVESAAGIGSAFSIFLPRSAEDATPAQPTRPGLVATGMRATILLVEDEPGVRAVTARTLRGLGHTVIEASAPVVAIAIAEAGVTPFDLLLTDLMMPGMNGRDLADRLAAQRPGLPVIYMSGYPPETIVGDGLLDEGTPLLHKPFTREELAGRVQRALERLTPPPD